MNGTWEQVCVDGVFFVYGWFLELGLYTVQKMLESDLYGGIEWQNDAGLMTITMTTVFQIL